MIFFIFPHQLYYSLSHLDKSYKIYIIEEPRYFTYFKYHKLKLAYHRATMKKYYDYLDNKKYNVTYINFYKVNTEFYKSLNDDIKCIFPADNYLQDKLLKIYNKKLEFIENINFLIKQDELPKIKSLIYKNNSYSHDAFYKYQRLKLNILIKDNKPVNNKWSFDTENRLALPNDIKVPKLPKVKSNKYIKEAINYVNKHFSDNYGSLDNFIYPIDNKSSVKWLNNFLKERLLNFGPYEDAVSENELFVYHSVLSPMMNIGILTDTEVVTISYKYYLSHTKSISIQSFEGFIRQVIGWRNYVYTLYLLEGEKMRESNYLKHNNKINKMTYIKFWTGTTNIKPIDSIINKIINYSYAHHIERLMYLGNFMLLCLIDPIDIYKMFMEWTIDAYDWVMIPNVFGMSQFAVNKLMMNRPYFSSSNYIHNMSTWKKTEDWANIWDALYYNFINKHQNILRRNYATSRQVKHWDNKSSTDKEKLLKVAKDFLNYLFK